MIHTILDARKIIATIEQLCLRIEDRFPDSGLLGVARTVHGIAAETDRTIRWIERPNYWLRALSILFIATVLGALAFALSQVDFEAKLELGDLVQITEAALNELILIGAGVIFLVTLETRRKRKRVIAAINQLRSIAHVIDAHQLTKDPGVKNRPTAHSPKRTLTPHELQRYLDYCSELLALTGKVGFLYVQTFHDPAAEGAVNDLENLTIGLSRKIWQKIALLHAEGNAKPVLD